jgi:hypothetical protein
LPATIAATNAHHQCGLQALGWVVFLDMVLYKWLKTVLSLSSAASIAAIIRQQQHDLMTSSSTLTPISCCMTVCK